MNNSRECPTCEGRGTIVNDPWNPASDTTCPTCQGTGEIETVTYCATCGNPADNPAYAKACCTPDNMLED